MAGAGEQASAEEVTELMADDRSIPPTSSPYAGELPARDKIADVYTAGYLQATERHLRFATARLGLRLCPGATILDFGYHPKTELRSMSARGCRRAEGASHKTEEARNEPCSSGPFLLFPCRLK